MKRFLLLFSLTVSCALSAAPIEWAALSTVAYGGDVSPSVASADDYSTYLCSLAAAQEIFPSVELWAIETMIQDDFYGVKSSLDATSGSHELTAAEFSVGQYSFSGQFTPALNPMSQYLGIVLYDNALEQAYRVFGLSSAVQMNEGIVFDDVGAPSLAIGEWHNTPEPTTGILVLFGLATLALRRSHVISP